MQVARRVSSTSHFGLARMASLLAPSLITMASSRALPATMCGSSRTRSADYLTGVICGSAPSLALIRDATVTQTQESSQTPMSDTSTQDGTSNRQGGRGRHRRGGKNFRGNSSNSNRAPSQGRDYNIRPERKPQQTGFQKILSVLTFGLLGKPTVKARPARVGGAASSSSAQRPERQSERPDRGDRPARSERAPRTPREPLPPGEVTTDRLYVGNLSYDAGESDLNELFSGVGQVKSAEVVVNSRTERSKGFAFVTMASIAEAKRAVDELNGKEFMGRQLQVNGAKPPGSDRGDRGDRRERDESENSESA